MEWYRKAADNGETRAIKRLQEAKAQGTPIPLAPQSQNVRVVELFVGACASTSLLTFLVLSGSCWGCSVQERQEAPDHGRAQPRGFSLSREGR